MRLALATLWILVGSAVTAGVYWLFLLTPESTVWTLMASAVLAVAALTMAGLTASGAIAMWWYGPSKAGIRRALQATAGAIPAALIVWVLGWMATRAEAWVTIRNGQISAWFISQFGWADVSWLFTGMHYAAEWLRWVVAAMLAWSLLAGLVAVGWSALGDVAWLRRALRPRALVIATFWFVILIALPWMYLVPWRPKQIPASAMEFVFIVTKLSVSAIVFAVGVALMAREASQSPAAPPDPRDSAQLA